MPEAPDLEAIRGFLGPRIAGVPIVCATIRIPIIARCAKESFASTLAGACVDGIDRRGKFLLFRLQTGMMLVINPMLTGWFQYVPAAERLRPKTAAVIDFENGAQLRYVDSSLMGKLYLVPEDELHTLPQFAEMGPDILDPLLTEAVFRQRLKRHPGMVKSILTNHTVVAGIGNAYADEILFVAGIHPYRKRTQLSEAESSRLYDAIGKVMQWAIPIVADHMRDELAYDEWRTHLRVHRKGGRPCPTCGNPISEITAGKRITNFYRRCQP